MNVIVIYDNSSETNTYNCVQLLLNALKLNIELKVTEFFLSKDYIYNGRLSYPDIDSKTVNGMEYIINSLDSSDLLIIASPVSKCDISNEMKLFLHRLSCCYLLSSSRSQINDKIGLSISTTSGAGLFYTSKILKRNLNSLGIKNTLKFCRTLYEISWEDVSLKTKMRIHKDIFKLSYKILGLHNRTYNKKRLILRKVIFSKDNNALIDSSPNIIQLSSWKYQTHLHNRHIQ